MRVIVIAKAPVPGRVKTRLCPPCTAVQAAALAGAALEDTVEAAVDSGADEVVLALDGEAPAWLPPGTRVVAQRGQGLDVRLAAAFDDAGAPALLVGMDTPQVSPGLLRRGFDELDAGDAVLGHAEDGGFWSVGLRRADRRVFRGVPMSTGSTGVAQHRRLQALGLRVRVLPSLRDVDLIDDARAVAAQAPGTRFAATLEAFGLSPSARRAS